ncbi:hypothetical protein [Hyalangium rubrum]|uniref:Uncharacterized protein n=1 Tax=Hyalangium rubrum TaxID=3103134 RepID=A0ABU5H753_9BACT|nr:hypothetical protein [Hyalangium sp. s54d21]MDY7227920.1 hypothetical protein [Hyalangium sp. s54d21]
MPSLDDLRLDLTGWTPKQHSESEAYWFNASGDLLSLHFFSEPPDIPVPLEDLSGLRATYRKSMHEVGGGIVEVDTVPLAGLRAIRTVFKFPQQPKGMTYLATLTLPFAECSYVLKVQCPEQGTTGVRDSSVFAEAMAQVQLSTQEEVQRWMQEQWAQDPYEPSDRGPVRRNRSDDARYDERFPEHPLSRARRALAHLERTVKVTPALSQARPFTGPSTPPGSAPQLLPHPRRHHYEFAHRVVPHLFLKDPARFLGALHQGAVAFLEHLWGLVGEDVPKEEVLASSGLGVEFHVDDDSVVAVLKLPPVRAVAEAILVGCHAWTSPAKKQAAPAPARYFTLELGALEDGTLRTVLGEWETPSWSHSNHGDGLPPTSEAFVAAIRAQVQHPASPEN